MLKSTVNVEKQLTAIRRDQAGFVKDVLMERDRILCRPGINPPCWIGSYHGFQLVDDR
jgi:hypothetical protein